MTERETMREKLVELLEDGDNPVWGWFPNNATMLLLADHLIANGVTIQRWIPVSEPPKVWEDEETKVMVDYLVYSPEYGIFVAHWCEPAERWLVDGESVRVTHWRPMPEPPKENERE